MKRVAHIMRAFIALLLALVCSQSVALAVPLVVRDAPVSLSVEFEMNGFHIPNGQFDLYRVGTIDTGGVVTLLPKYASTYSLGDSTSRKGWARLARQMAADFQAKGTEPQETVYTDASGFAAFGSQSALSQGVYLIVGHDTKVGKDTYSSLPYLVTLPLWDEETQSWTYDVLTQPKVSKVTEGEPQPGPNPNPNPDSGGGKDTKKTSKLSQLLAKTGDQITYWLSYAVIGCALVEIGLTIKRAGRKS